MGLTYADIELSNPYDSSLKPIRIWPGITSQHYPVWGMTR